MTKIVITGAAGFIGSHVCSAALDDGRDVLGIDNFDAFYDRRIKEASVQVLNRRDGFEFVPCDIRETDGVAELFAGVDAVVHLAARAGVRPSIQNPALYMSVNVEGTASILEAARRAGVAKFVFGSSSSVYGDSVEAPFREDTPAVNPISPYGASKRAGELLCDVFSHLFGMTVATVRLFTVYGARQRPDLAIHKFTKAIIGSESIFQYGDGSSERDYTYIDDIVGGVLGAVRWTEAGSGTHEIFNLGESCTVRLSYLIQLLGESIGIEPRVEVLPDQPGDVHRTCADISKARDVLGYRPKVSIEDGVPLFVEWYRKSKAHAELAAS